MEKELINEIQKKRLIDTKIVYNNIHMLSKKFAFKIFDKNKIFLLGYNKEVNGTYYFYSLEESELIEVNNLVLNEILFWIEKIINNDV